MEISCCDSSAFVLFFFSERAFPYQLLGCIQHHEAEADNYYDLCRIHVLHVGEVGYYGRRFTGIDVNFTFQWGNTSAPRKIL